MNFIISNSSQEPIYQQIEKEIKKAIQTNELKDLKISILTVKKAYDELEQEGYLKTVQGKGSFVAIKNQELIKEEQIKKIERLLEEIVRDC